MRRLQTLISALLLITTPALFVYPQDRAPYFQVDYKSSQAGIRLCKYGKTPAPPTHSYDAILQLIHKIESGELENRCPPDYPQ